MIGLYIHIPFCRSKCNYCNFFSVQYNNDILIDNYICSLLKHCKKFANRKINSVYIGGGTPSILSLKQMQKFLLLLYEIFDFSNLVEFTFELNPESTSREKLCFLKEIGVNRLSFGLQSTDDAQLKFLGRLHDFKTFCDVYNAARKENFNNINIDLMYGLPNQTLKNWSQIIKNVIIFNSEHLSVYPLSIEKGTKFYKNDVAAINDDIQRNMYDIAVEILELEGYNYYEISNWSKKNKESFHNTNYWRNLEYIGIGSGASGYLENKRYKNVENIGTYIYLLENNFNVKIENEYINDKTVVIENIVLGLRLLNEGISINCFNDKKHHDVLLKFIKNKILKIENNRVRLDKKYAFVFNQIILEFI
ncbi:MAG: radical SAM family heme chaperone HemW [Endomicrobium sp.]|jgi:oxygen-independent coproporphyrinogen-3 oxidase|nr:radical SAM family heme chaperone HemW [Endomicrobium sp.]